MANPNAENSLLFRESEIIELEDDPTPDLDRALSLTLAGKILSTNRPSLSNITYFTSKQWECLNRLKVFDHGGGLYTFEFVSDSDVLKVIAGGPWFVDGKLLLIQRVNPFLSLNRLVFNSTKLWVRCFELPPKAFNVKFAKAIGEMLGGYCDCDLPTEGQNVLAVAKTPSVRKFLRIKVLLNLEVPLKRTQSLKLKNSSENRVDIITAKLAYERLPCFCYRCGIIGHNLDGCNLEGAILYDEGIKAEKFYRKHNGTTPEASFPDQTTDPISAPSANPQEVPNPLTLDPGIILANFRQYREEGNLPAVPPSHEAPLFGSFNQAIIPLDSANLSLVNPHYYQPQPATTQAVDFEQPRLSLSEPQNSILGAIPDPKGKGTLPPIHPNSLGMHKALIPTYYNPRIPSSDLFSPSSQRCLFKSDLIHPALSILTKTVTTSPPDLSPINSFSSFLTTPTVSNEHVAPGVDQPLSQAATVTNAKGKSIGSPKAKRGRPASTSKSVGSPKAKRGRPPSGTPKNA